MLKKITIIFIILIFSTQSAVCISMGERYPLDRTKYIEQLLQDNLAPLTRYTCTLVPRGFVISIAESDFFENNSACITPRGKIILNVLGEILKEVNRECTIEGHSEEVLSQNSIYKSDWELSIVRAETILRYLIENSEIPTEKIHSIGFGEILPYESKVTKKQFTDNRINFVIFDYHATR